MPSSALWFAAYFACLPLRSAFHDAHPRAPSAPGVVYCCSGCCPAGVQPLACSFQDTKHSCLPCTASGLTRVTLRGGHSQRKRFLDAFSDPILGHCPALDFHHGAHKPASFVMIEPLKNSSPTNVDYVLASLKFQDRPRWLTAADLYSLYRQRSVYPQSTLQSEQWPTCPPLPIKTVH